MDELATCVARWAESSPEKAALITADGQVTYSGLEQRVRSTQAALAHRGVGEGDRVAVCALNRIELVELFFACARLGAILFIVNNRLTGSEIRFQLDDAKPRFVLTEDRFASAIVDTGWAAEPIEGFGGAPWSDEVSSDAADPVIGEAPPASIGRLDHSLLLFYTSGTTGTPKGAVLTQRSVLFTILNGIAHESFSERSIVISVLPMFHVGGLNIQLLPALFAGGTVVIEKQFDPEALLADLRAHSPSHLLLVPAAMQALLDHPDTRADDFASLGALNCGSSIIPEDLILAFNRLGVAVVQVYGATETGPTAVVLGYDDAERVGSCGKAALHSEVRIVDADDQPVAAGVVGELQVRGPNLFSHYWRNPGETAAAFVDGWYRTGDLGRFDGEGFTFVTGRSKELIISGGENIYPAEVEQVLDSHPAVTSSAVIGRSDSRWGEAPIAFVILAAGEDVDVEQLAAWSRRRLASYKQPRDWILVDDLPRTSLGKVQKHLLHGLLDTNGGPTSAKE